MGTLEDFRSRSMKYWLKVCHMNWDRLPKQAYGMLLNSRIVPDRNWAELVKNYLCRLGVGFVWMTGGVDDEKRFLLQLRQRRIDCSMQNWTAKNHGDLYAWYSSFKQLHGKEKYLNVLGMEKFSDVLIRFRFGINDLLTNKRYIFVLNTDCPFCDERENEEHFLPTCPVYEGLRKKYVDKYMFKRNTQECKMLMEGRKEEMTRSLAMFLFYAFKLRDQILNGEQAHT